MNSVDKQYKELLQRILNKGRVKKDRTGTGTKSVFGHSMRFDMKEGFPLLTSKKMFTKGIIHELIWFLRGETNIKYLVDNDVHIWDGDAYKAYEKHCQSLGSTEYDDKDTFIKGIKENDRYAKQFGELGPIYGKQWRSWTKYLECDYYDFEPHDEQPIDQIQNLINDLKTNPDSRRLIVSAWNVGELDQMVLPPCHIFFQCYTYEMTEEERIKEWCGKVKKDISYAKNMTMEKLDELGFPKRKLSLEWYQRSVDVFLGLPFNIASYGLLLNLLAKEVNMIPDELIFSGGDCHIYLNHIDQCKQQIRQEEYLLPELEIANKSIFDIQFEDIKVINYKSSPSIKGELSN